MPPGGRRGSPTAPTRSTRSRSSRWPPSGSSARRGWGDGHILEEQYWRIGPCLVEDDSEEGVAPGVLLPFIHRPLHRYVNAMADAGLVIERMEEPAPPEGFLKRAAEYREAATI